MERIVGLMEHDYSTLSALMLIPVKMEVEHASSACEVSGTKNEHGDSCTEGGGAEAFRSSAYSISHTRDENEQGSCCTELAAVEVVQTSAYAVSHTRDENGQEPSGTQPPQWRTATDSVRLDPDIVDITKILTDPVRLKALLVEFGLSVAPPPSASRLNVGANCNKVGRKCEASEVWGACSELGFNSAVPLCKGLVTTVIRKQKSGYGSPCYRCTTCKKMISQRRGKAPWAQQSAAAPESFFHEVDSAGRPNVKMSKHKILWIVYCMAKGLSATVTRELGGKTFSMTSTTLVHWRQRVRQAVSRSLADRPRMGGSSERVQVGIFGRKAKGAKEEEGRLMLGLQTESTNEFRLRYIKRNDPSTIAGVISDHVLPGTRIVSNGGKAFRRVEVAEDEEGPMHLTHDTGRDRNSAKSSSKSPKPFFNTQKLRGTWRRVLSNLKQSGPVRSAQAFQVQLDWFWWVSLNGPERCKDSFLRLLESIADAYRG